MGVLGYKPDQILQRGKVLMTKVILWNINWFKIIFEINVREGNKVLQSLRVPGRN